MAMKYKYEWACERYRNKAGIKTQKSKLLPKIVVTEVE